MNHAPYSKVEAIQALNEIERIDKLFEEVHLLIGGLAVKQYVPSRNSHDIDLVCGYHDASQTLAKLYPADEWETIAQNNDGIREQFKIINSLHKDYAPILFGPKLLERENYDGVDWEQLLKEAVPIKIRNNETKMVKIPSCSALTYIKFMSFIGRDKRQTLKRSQDLQDISDLSNHKLFSPKEFSTIANHSNGANELVREFKLNEDQLKIFQKSSFYTLPKMLGAEVNFYEEQQSKKSKVITNQDDDWYKTSIKESIDHYLAMQGFPQLKYNREVTFAENLNIWSRSASNFSDPHKDESKDIRKKAFDHKYGDFDYKNDLRSKYPNTWFSNAEIALKPYAENDKQVKIAAMASNDGTEIGQILDDWKTLPEVTILDLSSKAAEKGKSKFPQFNFQEGNMESCKLKSEYFDLYINLRSIHSSGVDIRDTLSECLRILKPGGLAIMSISDGYLVKVTDQEANEQRGMYDHRSNSFLIKKPYIIADKLREKMRDYGFVELEQHTGKTEIFVWGLKKGKQDD